MKKCVVQIFALSILIPAAAFSQAAHSSHPDSVILRFTQYSYYLSPVARKALRSFAAGIDSSDHRKIVLAGNAGNLGGTTQLTWDQINAIFNYLVDHVHLNSERFIWRYDTQETSFYKIKVRFARPGEDGDYRIAPPSPANHKYFKSVP